MEEKDRKRFREKTRADPETGCVEWTGGLNTSGYGQFHLNGRLHVAHRVAYIDQVGPIPDGLVLDHLCRNRRCVNVEHLEPVTGKENILRGESPPAKEARKTRCENGHEKTPEDRRRRRCIRCDIDKKRADYAANREQAKAKNRAYYAANREQAREQQRAYREANRERARERDRTRYLANRERILEQRKAHHWANREQILEAKRARYAAKEKT